MKKPAEITRRLLCTRTRAWPSSWQNVRNNASARNKMVSAGAAVEDNVYRPDRSTTTKHVRPPSATAAPTSATGTRKNTFSPAR